MAPVLDYGVEAGVQASGTFCVRVLGYAYAANDCTIRR